MMTGWISADREAVIPVTVQGLTGHTTIEAVIDTGFTDYFTLPTSTVSELQLPFREAVEFTLGDGNLVVFKTYTLVMVWDESEISIPVLASEGGSLIGMSLLYGYRVVLDVIDGGVVTVERRP